MGLFSMIAGEGQAAVTVSQSLLDSMTTVASDCLTFLSSALPIALPVLGAITECAVRNNSGKYKSERKCNNYQNC